jgi:hypothetical protein
MTDSDKPPKAADAPTKRLRPPAGSIDVTGAAPRHWVRAHWRRGLPQGRAGYATLIRAAENAGELQGRIGRAWARGRLHWRRGLPAQEDAEGRQAVKGHTSARAVNHRRRQMRLVVSLLALIMLGVSAQAMPRAASLADSNNVVHTKMSHPTCNKMRQMHRMMKSRKMPMTCNQIMRMHHMMMRA